MRIRLQRYCRNFLPTLENLFYGRDLNVGWEDRAEAWNELLGSLCFCIEKRGDKSTMVSVEFKLFNSKIHINHCKDRKTS